MATIMGGSGNARIDAAWLEPGASHCIIAGDGTIFVRAGNLGDTVFAGSGTATLVGGSGSDALHAGDGSFVLAGGNGGDSLFAGNSQVTLSGGGNDLLQAGAGQHALTGDHGSSTVAAGGGKDMVQLGSGSALVDLGACDDRVLAGNGSFTIHGGSGDDTVLTGDGSATIDGGSAMVAGGNGHDLFIIDASGSYDIITDLRPGHDILKVPAGLNGLPLHRPADAAAHASHAADGIAITLGSTVVVLPGLDLAGLLAHPDNYIRCGGAGLPFPPGLGYAQGDGQHPAPRAILVPLVCTGGPGPALLARTPKPPSPGGFRVPDHHHPTKIASGGHPLKEGRPPCTIPATTSTSSAALRW